MQKKWWCTKRNKILIVALSDGWSRMGNTPPSPSLKTTLVKIGQEKDNHRTQLFIFHVLWPPPSTEFLDPLKFSLHQCINFFSF